jgi:protoporphyrinogen oxidase
VLPGLGLEYFCTEGDALWRTQDHELIELGKREVEQIGLARAADVEDGCVFRMAKAYPIYDSDYADALGTVRRFVDGLENLQTMGRNGLHRYNNSGSCHADRHPGGAAQRRAGGAARSLERPDGDSLSPSRLRVL